MTASLRVVVADDHPVVRRGIASVLAADDDIEVVAEAVSGRTAIDEVRRHQPDVVVMDLQMPDGSGVDATAAICADDDAPRVLVVTTFGTDDLILAAIEAGASGYVLKDAGAGELRDAVRRVAAGETVLAQPVAARLVERTRGGDAGALTGRELEILARVAEGGSNADVAQALHIGQATVKTHLLHIFDKLGVNDRTAAVTEAYRRGLLRIDRT